MSLSQDDGAKLNEDKELWREKEGDYYAPSLFVTKTGGIGMNVHGRVFVKPIQEWHKMNDIIAALRSENEKLLADLRREQERGDKLTEDIEKGFMPGAYARLQNLQESERLCADYKAKWERAVELLKILQVQIEPDRRKYLGVDKAVEGLLAAHQKSVERGEVKGEGKL